MAIIKFHTELKVYQKSFESAMEIFNLSLSFPKEEKYSLTDQIRRSSRSVSANIAEAWGKRRYPKSFILKLTDAEGEARETQCWLEFALQCNYISEEHHGALNSKYNEIIAMMIHMINHSDQWTDFNPKENQ